MDELDSQLKHLAEMAKQYPQGSRSRNKYLTRLMMMIDKSGKLYCAGRYDYPQEVYHEALQEVRLYISRNIDSYDPSRALMMTWGNQKLTFTFRDSIKEDTLVCEKLLTFSDEIRKYIEEDPDDIFKQKYIRGRPEISFQSIALRMFEGYSRREIAETWQIEEQTLYSFFSRACKKLQPVFLTYFEGF